MIARIMLAETRAELTKFARLPAYVIPTLAFPVAFYAFFGLALNGSQHIGAFGVIGCAPFGFGVSVASERGQGWLLVKRASPMPPAAYFIAKLLTTMAFATVIVRRNRRGFGPLGRHRAQLS